MDLVDFNDSDNFLKISVNGVQYIFLIFIFVGSVITIMADLGSIIEQNEMIELVVDIEHRNNYLAMFQNRQLISACKRAELVQIQMEKAKLIATLKTRLRNMMVIPERVKKIYF